MAPLKFAVLGTGFWSNFQIAAWQEVGGVDLVAVYNRTVSKAEKVAARFNVSRVYGDVEQLLEREKLDFVDIITEIDAHAPFVKLAARHGLPVICQKPMAPDLPTAEDMVDACRKAEVPFFIHENWRWQTPIRSLRQVLDEGRIGIPFRARVDMISGFPVFDNQPFLKTLKNFIITDLGSHILDVARVLFGEAGSLYCRTHKIHSDIAGEDVATIVMNMGGRTTVTCNMAYAGNYLEHDHFPQTCIFVEADRGSVELGPDYWLRVTTRDGTLSKRVPPPRYSWADPDYDVVHASAVPCNANLLRALKGEGPAETTGEDNLRTVRLVFASYESASADRVIRFP
jgi:predicted dehydrogenase